mgnify:CR=1 FL=1
MIQEDYFQKKNLKKISGYTETKFADCYEIYPTSIEECKNLIEIASNNNLTICSKGSGLSYSDLITNDKNIVLNLTNFNEILNWNNQTGVIEVETGVTFGKIYNITMLDGWVLPSCPGSMDITVGGAISNNVHGKDIYKMGNFGDHVISLDLLLASGKIISVDKKNNKELFNSIIGGMGLIGIIIRAKLQLKKIISPYVESINIISKNIEHTFEIFEKTKDENDFSVAWADCFTSNFSLGRGFVSLAKWSNSNKKIDKSILKNELRISNTKSKYIFNILPANLTWSVLKYFAQRNTFRAFNSFFYNYQNFKHMMGINKTKYELFNKYNFIHNKLPDIKNIHKPHGFLEFQPLIPKNKIEFSIKEIFKLCKKFKCESLLCGVKIHRSDNYYLSYQLDGYSMGIDIQLKDKKIDDILLFSNDLNNLVSDLNGKIYLAKDEYLNKKNFEKMYPDYKKFFKIKNKYDSKNLFTSDLFKRIT